MLFSFFSFENIRRIRVFRDDVHSRCVIQNVSSSQSEKRKEKEEAEQKDLFFYSEKKKASEQERLITRLIVNGFPDTRKRGCY